MIKQEKKKQDQIQLYPIKGSRRLSNYFWSISLFLGGCGFICAGISSYINFNLVSFIDGNQISFFPQGIVMLFYGSLQLGFSIFISLLILWDYGGGYNEFNRLENLVRIVRKGFPGINKEIYLVYPIQLINSIKLCVKDGINPQRAIYMSTKDNRNIPLTPLQEIKDLEALEKEAFELAKFLNVRLEEFN